MAKEHPPHRRSAPALTEGQTVERTATPAERADKLHSVGILYLVFEADRPLSSSARFVLANTHAVRIGRGSERRGRRKEGELTVTVPDRWLSNQHCRLAASFGRWILDDASSKNGTFVNGRPASHVELTDGDWIEAGRTFFLFRTVACAEGDMPEDLDLSDRAAAPPDLVTLDPDLARKLEGALRMATTNVSILIGGESGTGKEVLARALHRRSGREGDFIAVNCGAIPHTLVESELFGYKKGAFSGADSDQPGLVRSAHQGTLFLDEIGDLPLSSQAPFLRVLQEREVRPVGSTRSLPVDIRLICASHRDLDREDSARLRRDLFARIAGFRVDLPPLRERREDLGVLIAALLRRVCATPEKVAFDIDAARALVFADWPLNIRELENRLATAVVLAGEDLISLAHLSLSSRAPATADVGDNPQQRETLRELLVEHKGNISAVARVLGKDRKQIQRWVKRYDLKPESFRS